MICPNCGKEIPDKRRFCSFCGVTVPPPAQDTPPEAKKPEPVLSQEDKGEPRGQSIPAPAPAPEKPRKEKKQKPPRPLLSRKQLAIKIISFSFTGLAVFVMLIVLGAKFGNSGPGALKPKYSIINESIIDTPATTKITVNCLVSGIIDAQWIDASLKKIYHRQIKRSGFRHHDFPTDVIVYMFTSMDHYNSGRDQWIAMLEQTAESGEISISLNETALETLSQPPEEKFGFQQKEREVLWRDLVMAEMRARKEADRKYPTSMTGRLAPGEKYFLPNETHIAFEMDGKTRQPIPAGSDILIIKTVVKDDTLWYYADAFDPAGARLARGWLAEPDIKEEFAEIDSGNMELNAALFNELLEKYRAELLAKYNITADQADAISTEGLQKNWAYPVMK